MDSKEDTIDNLFADPFSDPAISSALSQGQSGPYSTLDGSLSDDHIAPHTTIPLSSSTSIALSPASANGGVETLRLDELRAKESELQRREAALLQREADIVEQEEQLRQQSLTNRKPNWPPFYPLIFHSIDDEVPVADKPEMKKLYFYWLATVAVPMEFDHLCLVTGHKNNE